MSSFLVSMRSNLLALFAGCVVAFLVSAQSFTPTDVAWMGQLGAPAVSGDCSYPTKDSDNQTGTDQAWLNDSYYGLALKFTAAATYTPRQIKIALRLGNADPGKTLTAYIHTDNAGAVGTLVATSQEVSTSEIGGAYSAIVFDIDAEDSGEISSSGSYWLVLKADSVSTFSNQSYADAAAGAFGDKWAIFTAGAWVYLNSWRFNWSVHSCD